MTPPSASSDVLGVEAAIDAAERDGLVLALKARTVALVVLLVWIVIVYWRSGLANAGLVCLFIAFGLAHWRLIRTGRERRWMRYLIWGADIVAIGAIAVSIPLSAGGDVPQINVFRAYGVKFLFLFVVLSGLSLSPGLVLFVGAMSIATLWAGFAWIVAGMERTVSWIDLPPRPDAEAYLAVLLDPDFIGTGNRVEESLVLLAVSCVLALVVQRARRFVLRQASAQRDRARAEALFGRFVPDRVVHDLDSSGRPAQVTREASILFLDVAGFTTLSEEIGPEQSVRLLDQLFEMAGEGITAEGGIVIGYAGDALIAAFNLPDALPGHASRATAAGRAILERVAAQPLAGQSLRLRIGVATGPVAAGAVGGSARLAYTVIGDTVNLAQRLQEYAKTQNWVLALSEETGADLGLAASHRAAPFQVADRVVLPGRSQSCRVYGLEDSAIGDKRGRC
jgi:adenylate cyclase